jgi:hypothetical protein
MPSEDRIDQAMAALKGSRDQFHSAVIAAIEEVSAFIATQRAPEEQRATQEAVRLGAFAAGRIDVDQFSRLLGRREALDPARLEELEHALRVLKGFAHQSDELFRVRMLPGADLRDTVREALATRGRAFSTAHQIDALRTGRNGRTSHMEYGTLDFGHWSKAERRLAPPLIIELEGTDLRAAGLAEYLDGAQKIVLLVNGPAAPAPLARLIGPRTFVLQTTDPAALGRLGSCGGPGIAAVMQEGAALFVHDPARGDSLAHRLEVGSMPAPPQRALGGLSAQQQADDLAWLAELDRLAALARDAAGADAATEPAVTPADQLAAWLLRQTDMSGVG